MTEFANHHIDHNILLLIIIVPKSFSYHITSPSTILLSLLYYNAVNLLSTFDLTLQLYQSNMAERLAPYYTSLVLMMHHYFGIGFVVRTLRACSSHARFHSFCGPNTCCPCSLFETSPFLT